jgi:hypothetical protein
MEDNDTGTKQQRTYLTTKNSQEHRDTNSTASHEGSPTLAQASGATKKQQHKELAPSLENHKRKKPPLPTEFDQPHVAPFTQSVAFKKNTTLEA